MSMSDNITDEIVCDFRRFFPEFSDCNKWPTAIIRQNMIEADCQTGGSGWKSFDITKDSNFKKRGMYYYCGHKLTVTYGNNGANDPTSVKSEARLNIASKSVGDESVTYRITAMENTADDFLSTTLYGQMFVTLRRRATPTPLCI